MRFLSRAAQSLAFLLPFAFYAASLSAEPSKWDTAEMQSVPYLLGIAHPTGFPLYVLAGWAWSHALPFGSVAFRMNLFSATTVAAACWLLYETAVLLEAPWPAALCGTFAFAFGHNVWWNGQRADVHSLALPLGALTIYALVRRYLEGGTRFLYVAAAGLGLGLAVHPNGVWLVPGFILILALDARRHPVGLRQLALCAGIVALSLSLYAYLPLRSAYVSAHGIDPIAALPGVDSFLYDYLHPASMDGFVREVTGSDFDAGKIALAAPLEWWKFGSYASRWIALVVHQCGILGLPLACAGLIALVRRDAELALALAVLGLGAVPFSYAFAIESDPERYRLLSLWFAGLCIAAAPNALRELPFDVPWRWAAGAATAFAAANVLALNVGMTAERHSLERRPFIRDVAAAVPAGSAIVAIWSDATTLGYAAYVDGTLPGRIVVSSHPEDVADWPASTARSRPVYLLSPEPVEVERGRVERVLPGVSDRFLYRYFTGGRGGVVKGTAGPAR